MSSIDIRDRSLTFWDGGMFSIRDDFFKNRTKQNYRLFFNGCKIGNVSSNLTTSSCLKRVVIIIIFKIVILIFQVKINIIVFASR